jgi:hypothetical protein
VKRVTSSRNGAGADDLPAGAALPINVVAAALRCSRLEVLRLIEENDLPGIGGPSFARSKQGLHTRTEVVGGRLLRSATEKVGSPTGESISPQPSKPMRIAPTKERRERYGPAEALLKWLRAS